MVCQADLSGWLLSLAADCQTATQDRSKAQTACPIGHALQAIMPQSATVLRFRQAVPTLNQVLQQLQLRLLLRPT